MLGIIASVTFAAPLVVATILFISRGDLGLALFTGTLAVVGLYLPQYIIRGLTPRTLIPDRLKNIRD